MKYYAARPLVANIPNPKEGYTLDQCPLCGAEVWARPIEKDLKHLAEGTGFTPMEFIFVCTQCALNKQIINK